MVKSYSYSKNSSENIQTLKISPAIIKQSIQILYQHIKPMIDNSALNLHSVMSQ